MTQIDFRIPQAAANGLEDGALCWAVIEKVWPETEAEDTIAYVTNATRGQRAVYTTMLFAREVDNGGYRQFFWNSSGMYYQHVLDGLKVLGATSQHEALSRFVGFFPPGKDLIQQRERQLGLEGMSEEQKSEIKSYERSVYRSGGFERSLTPLWVRYIAFHPEDFFK